MDFNNILKKTIEIGKDLKMNAINSISTNGEKYNRDYWDLILKIAENENQEFEYNGKKFICQKNAAHSFESGFFTFNSVTPVGNDIKISFMKEDGKEFSFETKNYKITYSEKGLIFIKGTEEKLSKQFFITNSSEILKNVVSTGINKIKFIIIKNGIIIDRLFDKFLNSPETFENYIEKLWEDFSEPFKINYNEAEKSLNEIEHEVELFKLNNDGHRSFETIHAPINNETLDKISEHLDGTTEENKK